MSREFAITSEGERPSRGRATRMMGSKARVSTPPCNRSLEDLVPADRFYRHLEAKLDDLGHGPVDRVHRREARVEHGGLLADPPAVDQVADLLVERVAPLARQAYPVEHVRDAGQPQRGSDAGKDDQAVRSPRRIGERLRPHRGGDPATAPATPLHAAVRWLSRRFASRSTSVTATTATCS